jgi:hypothetical protein
VQGLKEANGRLGNSFHFGFAKYPKKIGVEEL